MTTESQTIASFDRACGKPGKEKNPAVEGWVFVASEGFEPPKAEPADLQSVPFGHLGN